MSKTTITDFSHLVAMRPAARPDDLPPGTPFAHLLGGGSQPSRIDGWEHRTRAGGYTTNNTDTKEHAR